MFGFFTKKAEKREVEELKRAVQTGFNSAKHDINSMSTWIRHLDDKDSKLKNDISEIYSEIATIKEEIENLKNVLSIVGEKPVFKQKQTVFNKQTPVYGVLNTVQTGVQTAFLDNLSATERAIIFVLLNSEMKLSYEDLAAMLGKRKATIRGQINTIKQKSEGLVEEIIGENNKKRVYIPDRVREVLLKSKKIRNKDKEKRKFEIPENQEEN